MPEQKIESAQYRNCFIVEHKDGEVVKGVDVVDMASGRWMVAKNVRTARWTASVWARLQFEFGILSAMPPKHPPK